MDSTRTASVKDESPARYEYVGYGIFAAKAMEDANITVEDIDLILVATVTPDMSFLPSLACCKRNWR